MLSDAEVDPELFQPLTILDRELVAAHVQFFAKVQRNFLRSLALDYFAILLEDLVLSLSDVLLGQVGAVIDSYTEPNDTYILFDRLYGSHHAEAIIVSAGAVLYDSVLVEISSQRPEAAIDIARINGDSAVIAVRLIDPDLVGIKAVFVAMHLVTLD